MMPLAKVLDGAGILERIADYGLGGLILALGVATVILPAVKTLLRTFEKALDDQRARADLQQKALIDSLELLRDAVEAFKRFEAAEDDVHARLSAANERTHELQNRVMETQVEIVRLIGNVAETQRQILDELRTNHRSRGSR